ncbi:MAG TPA: hypothetical protein VEJ16_06645 [Alphaproteobacteria bacterium]|nr:hypothetical protein [Alphaproteobacteria bacterium]
MNDNLLQRELSAEEIDMVSGAQLSFSSVVEAFLHRVRQIVFKFVNEGQFDPEWLNGGTEGLED